ncbi:dna polymerase delta subunit 2 protein [Rutstroemia sp. NJR-2017a BVV2]|nr:dna polymerase delta subunit 2 protein [Rutstroemia sp. NJR-2017a BVV2]
MLEDESGRLRLTGGVLSKEMLVTGCIVAVMGTENADGDFEVVGIEVPDLPPQDERWGPEGKPDTQKDEEEMEIDDSQPRKKIAIVSGLSFSGTISDHSLEKSLLTEYLLGETSSSAHEISRLIIAGNSIALDQDVLPPLDTSAATTSSARKTQKKYGYDASAYNPAPTAHFDSFLAELLPSLPITLLPGETDPANASFPQQPIHPAMFPQSRAYVTGPRPGEESSSSSSEPSWLSPATNPHSCLLDGWSTLITSGQNVSDVYKYIASDDRLEIMEALCRWRCIAPTAPDTLWSYPFQDDDPFVMHKCPHIFIVGNQPEFDTAVIEGPEGQSVRLVAVPAFAETGELVLMDVETRECERVRIRVEGGGGGGGEDGGRE